MISLAVLFLGCLISQTRSSNRLAQGFIPLHPTLLFPVHYVSYKSLKKIGVWNREGCPALVLSWGSGCGVTSYCDFLNCSLINYHPNGSACQSQLAVLPDTSFKMHCQGRDIPAPCLGWRVGECSPSLPFIGHGAGVLTNCGPPSLLLTRLRSPACSRLKMTLSETSVRLRKCARAWGRRRHGRDFAWLKVLSTSSAQVPVRAEASSCILPAVCLVERLQHPLFSHVLLLQFATSISLTLRREPSHSGPSLAVCVPTCQLESK